MGDGPFHIAITPRITIDIDIKPGSDPNYIYLEELAEYDEEDVCEIKIEDNEVEFDEDVLPVAILATSDFDTDTVDGSTVELGDPELDGTVQPIGIVARDVDNDGDEDLLLFFCIPGMVANGALDVTSTELVLAGETFDGIQIEGVDPVIVVPGYEH